MSGRYSEGREAAADGNISWSRSEIVACLVSQAYVFSPDHRASTRPLRDVVLAETAVPERVVEVGGWLKCGRLVFKQVPAKAGARAAAVVFKMTGEDGTLIFYCNEVANFPMVPNGGDIEIDVPERGLFRA